MLQGSPYTYQIKSEAQKAALSEVYRVHDYNYLMKVKQLTEKLRFTENKTLARYGKVPLRLIFG